MSPAKGIQVAVNGYGVIGVCGNELFHAHTVGNQAIVVPESIDAIRALTGAESDAKASIARGDVPMGIGALPR